MQGIIGPASCLLGNRFQGTDHETKYWFKDIIYHSSAQHIDTLHCPQSVFLDSHLIGFGSILNPVTPK